MTKGAYAIAIFSIAALWAGSCAAEGALAIGLPARGPSGGFVYGYSTNRGLDEAQTKAMNFCRGIEIVGNKIPDNPSEAQRSCKIVGTFQDQCGAAAHNGTKKIAATGVGWAIAPDRIAAKSQALAQCEAMAGGRGQRDCEVEDSFCDGTAN